MSLGSFLKSLVNAEAMGDEIIAVQERGYLQAQRMYCGADPHMLLAQLWLARRAAWGEIPTDKMHQVVGMHQIIAFTETMQFACIAPPNNMRALGLYFIYKERPDIIQNYPKFGSEFARLMAPIMAATESGGMEALYQRFNPQMAAQAKAAEESNGGHYPQTGTAQGSKIKAKAQERAPDLKIPAAEKSNSITRPQPGKQGSNITASAQEVGRCPHCGGTAREGVCWSCGMRS